MTTPARDDALEALATLAEPTRRALYDFVVDRPEPVGRDEAAAALGISRELAAFHLDRLARAGLLATEYRRLSGRTGPGAGRPAKLYRRVDRELEVSLPARHYDRAATLMAEALRRLAMRSGLGSLAAVARDAGKAVGADARRAARTARHRARSSDLLAVLRDAGYEPLVETDGSICLRNCPYQTLAATHRDVTCGMNLAWAEGVVDGLGVPGIDVELAPEAGRCCVVFHADRPSSVRSAVPAG